jgi:hypothetical protein
MRYLALVLVMGCGGDNGASNERCPLPAGEQTCAETCGDGVIDPCSTLVNLASCIYRPGEDPCDGDAFTTSCAALGYPRGQLGCSKTCAIEETSCDPCEAGNLCGGFATPSDLDVLAVSGDKILIVGTETAAILDAQLQVEGRLAEKLTAAAAIPGGWLATDGQALLRITTTATRVPFVSPTEVMTGGHPSHVLLHWSNATDGVKFALVDFAGNLVGAPKMLAMAAPARAATDGVSFFVGTGGTLYRIATDGTVTSTSGFPKANVAEIVWGGTTGWYITIADHRLQRFDAAGALVGPVIDLGAARFEAFVADGDRVVATRREGNDLALVRIDSTGVTASVKRVGVSGDPGSRLARIGSDFVVGWQKAAVRIARVATF